MSDLRFPGRTVSVQPAVVPRTRRKAWKDGKFLGSSRFSPDEGAAVQGDSGEPQLSPARQRALEACRNWLRYRPDREIHVSPKVSRMDEGGHGSGEDLPLGTYLPAMREAQMHWASVGLPPLHRALSVASRRLRRRQDVTFYLFTFHRAAWADWKASHPRYAYNELVEATASLMADRLGDDVY